MGLSRNLSLILGGATACTYMVASFIPLWVCETLFSIGIILTSLVDSWQIRTAGPSHDISCWPVIMLYPGSRTAFNWDTRCSVRCYCHGIHIPDFPWNRIFTNCKRYSWHDISCFIDWSHLWKQPWLYPAEVCHFCQAMKYLSECLADYNHSDPSSWLCHIIIFQLDVRFYCRWDNPDR